jgi:sulfonate transport system ATP-binding protein
MAGTPMTSTGPKISLQGVTKRFALGRETFTALDGISLDIADNEFVTVVGPSGCGKSTLLNILAGLEEPTEGRALVDGTPVAGPGPERGVIFQQYALFPWLTVRQNVEFGLRTNGTPKAERREKAEHFIRLVGLDRFADALPKALSGGMRQRCAIARAYAVNPSILLMDEPFGALDALTRVTLQEQLLDTWSEEKRTVLFITHDVDEAVFLSNRVIVMAARPGRVYDVVEVGPVTRDEEFRLSPEFAALRNRVWHSVYHQDGRSAASQPTTPA